LRVKVDQELCISCGACIDVCPEVFDWNEDEKAYNIVEEVPADAEDGANDALESCPTNAITEE
jgi:ferredoxin